MHVKAYLQTQHHKLESALNEMDID